jgi:hypothetical protein
VESIGDDDFQLPTLRLASIAWKRFILFDAVSSCQILNNRNALACSKAPSEGGVD